MQDLFTTGRVAEIILVVMALEALVLLAMRASGYSRVPTLSLLMANLASGAALILALRAALTASPWPWIAICLAASFLAHVFELWQRLKASSAP